MQGKTLKFKSTLLATYAVAPFGFGYSFLLSYILLLLWKVCQELYEDPTACGDSEHGKDAEDMETRSSYILLLYTAVLYSVSVLPALLLGSWSDGAGRRAVMVLPFLLSILSGGVLLALALVPSLSVYWCLLAAGVTGLSGGHVSVFLSSFSYLADATSDPGAGRTMRMAVAEAMIFVGGTVGFLLGGLLEQEVGLSSAFIAYVTCHVLAIFYILLWLRDPIPVSSTLGVLASDGQERLKLHLLILCTFINNTVAIGVYRVNPLGNKTERDVFDQHPTQHCCGLSYTAFRAASYVLLAFSTNTWMVFLGRLPALAPWRCTRDTLITACCKEITRDFTGSATCYIFGAVLFNGLYPQTLPTFPGMPFIVMAGFCVIVLILMHTVQNTHIHCSCKIRTNSPSIISFLNM
uniref:Major facilitator superfamily (MFS) profile domain-containing protein n=1 Tax=Electrophorus electricus TaxID=8005 RepID=A0A4W4HBY3_ELEEL